MDTLARASNQWSTRPADQRFDSLEGLHSAVTGHREGAAEAIRNYNELRIKIDTEGEPVIVGPQGGEAKFQNFAFGQLCARIGAPADY